MKVGVRLLTDEIVEKNLNEVLGRKEAPRNKATVMSCAPSKFTCLSSNPGTSKCDCI